MLTLARWRSLRTGTFLVRVEWVQGICSLDRPHPFWTLYRLWSVGHFHPVFQLYY